MALGKTPSAAAGRTRSCAGLSMAVLVLASLWLTRLMHACGTSVKPVWQLDTSSADQNQKSMLHLFFHPNSHLGAEL
jgi:hypothetical protein